MESGVPSTNDRKDVECDKERAVEDRRGDESRLVMAALAEVGDEHEARDDERHDRVRPAADAPMEIKSASRSERALNDERAEPCHDRREVKVDLPTAVRESRKAAEVARPETDRRDNDEHADEPRDPSPAERVDRRMAATIATSGSGALGKIRQHNPEAASPEAPN